MEARRGKITSHWPFASIRTSRIARDDGRHRYAELECHFTTGRLDPAKCDQHRPCGWRDKRRRRIIKRLIVVAEHRDTGHGGLERWELVGGGREIHLGRERLHH